MKGNSGHFHNTGGAHGGSDLGGLFADSTVHGFPKMLHPGQQGKHIVGHNNFKKGRSVFHGTLDDARRLIEAHGGTGHWRGPNREVVDFGRVIGVWVDGSTGERRMTTRGTIHYSRRGAHIVPSNPSPSKGGR